MHQKFHRAVTLKQQRRAARDAGSKGSPHSQHSTQSHHSIPGLDEDEDDFEDEEEWEGKHEGKEEVRKKEGTPIERSLNKAVAELSREYQVFTTIIIINKIKTKTYAAPSYPLSPSKNSPWKVPT
jgi:hypothetical protein